MCNKVLKLSHRNCLITSKDKISQYNSINLATFVSITNRHCLPPNNLPIDPARKVWPQEKRYSSRIHWNSSWSKHSLKASNLTMTILKRRVETKETVIWMLVTHRTKLCWLNRLSHSPWDLRWGIKCSIIIHRITQMDISFKGIYHTMLCF